MCLYSRRIGIVFDTIPMLVQLLLRTCVRIWVRHPSRVATRTRASVPSRTQARDPVRARTLARSRALAIPRVPDGFQTCAPWRQ